MPPPRVVVVDFNRTLVRESSLITWCLERLAHGALGARLRALGDIVFRGPAALALDLLRGRELEAARLALRAFRGASELEVATWARARLTLNPRAMATLAALGAEAGIDRLLVVSRGSPETAVRAWLEQQQLRPEWRAALGASAIEVLAPRLALAGGRFTGEVESGLLAKHARAGLVPEGGAFVGDARDEKWAREQDPRLRFYRV